MEGCAKVWVDHCVNQWYNMGLENAQLEFETWKSTTKENVKKQGNGKDDGTAARNNKASGQELETGLK